MNTQKTLIALVTLSAFAWVWDTPTAHASLQACGNVFVSSDASCEYRKTEQCMTSCTTAAVQTSCVAKLYTTCESGCTASSVTTCESSCGSVCTTDCQSQVAAPASAPEPPNCMGLCVSDCQHTCGDSGPRGGCCGHNCNVKCEAKCKGNEAPVALPEQCTPTCTSACSGSCTAQANIDCHLACQTNTYTECETALVETCETKCKDDGGAIFCDGQFLNAASASSCASELKAKLDFDINIDVKGAVTGTVDKVQQKCKDCSIGNVGEDRGGLGIATCFGIFAGVFGWRLRRRLAARREG